MIRLTQLFIDVKGQWPNEMKIDGCIPYDEEMGLCCESIKKTFWEIDNNCMHGEWGRLMNWGIFCGLVDYIRNLKKPYPEKIKIDCISLSVAIEKINESINAPDSDYHQERHMYENDLHILVK